MSPGADPLEELHRFAEEMRFSKKMESISLGQGQGQRAENMIRDGMERGTWVLLQNCHLAVSWMPVLERLVEGMVIIYLLCSYFIDSFYIRYRAR